MSGKLRGESRIVIGKMKRSAINRGRYKRNRRGVIWREGEEAVDHRQEIAIAGAGIPAAAL